MTPEEEALNLAKEQLYWLRFMRRVLTPLPPEVLNDVAKDDDRDPA